MADRAVVAGFALEPPGDLLGRPAALEPGHHVAAQEIVAAQLALPLSALAGEVLGVERVVADILPLAVKVVAADLAMDGRAMTAEFLGDDGDRYPCVERAEDRPTLGKIELAVRAGHGATPSGKRLKILKSCTSH